MNCINCGSKLPENSEICQFCETRNDLDLLSRKTTSDTHLKEEYTCGEGNIDEISREESEKKISEQLKKGWQKYKINMFRDIFLQIFSVLFIIIFLSSSVYLIYTNYLKTTTNKYYNEGLMYLKEGKIKFYKDGIEHGSLRCFESAINWYNKNNDRCYYLMGVSNYYIYLTQVTVGVTDRGRMEQAMTDMKHHIEKSLEVNDKYPEAHYYRGMYYYEKKLYDKAIEEFNISIRYGREKWEKDKNKLKKWEKSSKVMIKISNNLKKNKKEKVKVITPVIDSNENGFLLLQEADVLNWEKFLENLKSHYNILEAKMFILLSEKAKKEINNHKKGEDFSQQQLIIDELNKILCRKDLYDPVVFKDFALSKEMKGYIKKGINTLSPCQVRKFNRLLFDSIYSGKIIKPGMGLIKSNQISPPLPDELEDFKR